MQQKYWRLQSELRNLVESTAQNQNSVLKLLNKHIMQKPKGQSTHPLHLHLESPEDDTSLQQYKHYSQQSELAELLSRLFTSKCKVLQVYSSQDRKKTFVKTILKRNERASKLDLSVCNLPDELSPLINKYLSPRVNRIDLSQNQLSLYKLPRLFHGQLTELVLSNCGLHNNSFEMLFSKLKHTPIVRLCLSSPLPINRNILTKYETLYEFISSCQTLTILELASLQIIQYEELFRICSKSNITSLDLSGNNHVQGIYQFLEVLKLRNNSLDFISQLSLVGVNPQLHYLDLSSNQLTPGQFLQIFKTKPISSLRTLIVDENPLMYSLETFEAYISNTYCLEHLSMRKCKIGEEGIKQLMIGLQSNIHSLNILDLSNNKISRDSCGLLAEALKSSGLKELILVECEISDEGGEKIALQMRTNTKLHTLNLTQNRLNCKTGRAFVTSLHVNFTLTRLNLSLNAIPYDNMKEINSSIERNHYMKITNFKSSKPKVRVSLPDELIDEEQNVIKKHKQLKSQVYHLKSLYDELVQKCKQVEVFEQPSAFQDDGIAQKKYKQKLQQLKSEISRIQAHKQWILSSSTRNTPQPRLRERQSQRRLP